MLASLLASTSTVAAQPAGDDGEDGTYADTPVDTYYAEAVAQLAEQGVFAGTLCEDGFCPDEAIDRKTMAVWVVRLLDGTDPAAMSESRFSDVAADSFHAPFIERTAEVGVTQGCGDGSRFCPDRRVTRAQMASFVARAYNLPAASAPAFSDVAADAWYASDVARLAASGITTGCGDVSRFCPSDDTTRAQMAAFLWRADNASGRTPPPAEAWAIGETVSVGAEHSCAVRADHTVTCWGDDAWGKTDKPAGLFLTVAAGNDTTCGVRVDRTVACWGAGINNPNLALLFDQDVTRTPSDLFLSVSASAWSDRACGLRTDQTIVCWGYTGVPGSRPEPAGQFLSVSTGGSHACGVSADRSVACWILRRISLREDDDTYVWVEPGNTLHTPTGRFLSVSAGGGHSCGVREDRTVECWRVSGAWSGHEWRTPGELHAPSGRFISVSAGYGHSCGLRVDETVECWHQSHLGEADGEALDAPTGRFRSVSIGPLSACGTRDDHTVECWGLGTSNEPPAGKFLSLTDQCGIRADRTLECWDVDPLNRFHNRDVPSGQWLTVSSLFGWTLNHVRKSMQCGVRTDQRLVCWDQSGEETEPFPSDRFLAVDAGGCAVHVDRTLTCIDMHDPVGGSHGVPSGQFRSVSDPCGLLVDSTVTCWSWLTWGELMESYAPPGRFHSVGGKCGVRVDETVSCWNHEHTLAVPSGRFLSVHQGWLDTCGIRADQSVTCWTYTSRTPRSNFTQLSDIQDEAVEGRFQSVFRVNSTWRGFGPRYWCGIRVDMTLGCWGLDVEEPPSDPYVPSMYRNGLAVSLWRPTGDADTAGGEVVSAGRWHTCGVRAERTISCWGSNYRWHGPGGQTNQALPTFGQFVAVSSGSFHSCGLRAADHTITCWGEGAISRYQSFPDSPARSNTAYDPSGTFLSMSVGHEYSCGVRVDRTVFCWENVDGSEASAQPGEFRSVSAGGGHSCGVRVDQTITCWGDNGHGQTDAPSGRFLSVSAGHDHSCGVRADETITCWANNEAGKAKAPAGKFVSVSAGGSHSCGVRVDQTITCWGSNQDRHGNHIGQATAPSGRFLAVSAGHRHSCALGTDRAVTCWGDNTSGWPIDEAECYAWDGAGIGFDRCDGISDRDRPSGQSDPPAGRFLAPTRIPSTGRG